MAALHCPLNPSATSDSQQEQEDNMLLLKGLHQVMQLEDHVAQHGSSTCPHPPLKDIVFGGRVKGTTPLMLACQHDQVNSVKRLVENWGVDVNGSAKYFPYRGLIESATPLFVAAISGQSQIVQYLLEKGADPNVKTSNPTNLLFDSLTPLCVAVSSQFPSSYHHELLRSGIVRSLLQSGADPCLQSSNGKHPLWREVLGGTDVITALINHGLDLKQRDPDGETLLLYMASLPSGFTENDSLTIIKLLIDKGADLLARDKHGLTPILRAAKVGTFNLASLDYLLEREEYDRMEKVDAMELAGAMILFSAKNVDHFPKAFEYWRQALYLRQLEIEERRRKKIKMDNGEANTAEKVFGPKKGGAKEWTTTSELEHVIHHPDQYIIQSHLVRMRVLSDRSWGAVGSVQLLFPFVILPLTEHIDLVLASLSTICLFDPRKELKGLKKLAVDVVHILLHKLTVETRSVPLNGQPTHFPFELFERSLDLILLAMKQFKPNQLYWFSFEMLFDLFADLFHLPGMLIEDDNNRNAIIQMLRERVGGERLGFMLSMACAYARNREYLATLRLLLAAGADPNVGVDPTGNGSLYLAVSLKDENLREVAIRLLLEAGAHVDRVNKAGETAVDIWIQTQKRNGAESEWNDRPDWCRTVPSLLCVAARSVRQNGIPYKEAPASLHLFVSMH